MASRRERLAHFLRMCFITDYYDIMVQLGSDRCIHNMGLRVHVRFLRNDSRSIGSVKVAFAKMADVSRIHNILNCYSEFVTILKMRLVSLYMNHCGQKWIESPIWIAIWSVHSIVAPFFYLSFTFCLFMPSAYNKSFLVISAKQNQLTVKLIGVFEALIIASRNSTH